MGRFSGGWRGPATGICLLVGGVWLASPTAAVGQPAVARYSAAAAPVRVPVAQSDYVIEAQARLRAALSRRVPMGLDNATLPELVGFLKQHGIPAQLDRRALDDAAIDENARVRLSLSSVQLSTALQQALSEVDLKWILRDDFVLITTWEVADANLTTCVFDVSSLLPYGEWRGQFGVERGFDFNSLMKTITSTIAPHSWEQLGGPAAIDGLTLNGVPLLLVSQTEEEQAQVEQLLRQLHRATRHGRPAAVRRRVLSPSRLPTTNLSRLRQTRDHVARPHTIRAPSWSRGAMF